MPRAAFPGGGKVQDFVEITHKERPGVPLSRVAFKWFRGLYILEARMGPELVMVLECWSCNLPISPDDSIASKDATPVLNKRGECVPGSLDPLGKRFPGWAA